MTTRHSTSASGREKPAKPRPDFPLFPHASGRWAKKVLGKTRYFGSWDDPQGALNRYLKDKDYLYAGKTPPPDDVRDGLTVHALCNRFLEFHENRAKAGEINPRTWRDYFATCQRLRSTLGKDRLVPDLTPADFETLREVIAKTMGQATLRVEITRAKSVFRYGYEQGLIDRPVRYGQGLKMPSKKAVQRERAGKAEGLRMFEPEQINAMLEATDSALRAMILLGANCGFGNTDVATLPFSALDLDGGWCNHARPKAGVARQCPLWSVTVQALREAIAKRPMPKDKADANVVFVTRYGHRYVRLTATGKADWKRATWSDAINFRMDDLLTRLKIKRRGLSFYSLRHTFRTVADEALDQPAVNFIMGHVDPTMAGYYRERIDDSRLRRVTDYVHDWLFPKDQAQ